MYTSQMCIYYRYFCTYMYIYIFIAGFGFLSLSHGDLPLFIFLLGHFESGKPLVIGVVPWRPWRAQLRHHGLIRQSTC